MARGRAYRKVVVLGFDGMSPERIERLRREGRLPGFNHLRERGSLGLVATTAPALTPVAWSTFATGVNPGGHGIFDFIRRDPATYRLELGLVRHERRSALLPPSVTNLRSGTPFWQHLGDAGVPSIVLRCPCTYPPDRLRGRLLSGMGVPDLRGGVGTATVITTDPTLQARDHATVTPLRPLGRGFVADVPGPRTRPGTAPLTAELRVTPTTEHGVPGATLEGSGGAVDLRPGEWSDAVSLQFRTGPLSRLAGTVRALMLLGGEGTTVYLSPVNFDPTAPAFPISHPPGYAGDLARDIGPYQTAGFIEDTNGLEEGWISEAEFLSQCDIAMREREAMLHVELARFTEGFLFCLFDTTDRLQHMFWRFEDADHPAHRLSGPTAATGIGAIDAHYEVCDRVVRDVVRGLDDDTLLLVMSDHGFCSFLRGVNLNAWLRREGWQHGRGGPDPTGATGLDDVDWSRTRAYAVGLGGIYLNVRGREGQGIVDPAEAGPAAEALARALAGLPDLEHGTRAVASAEVRSALYAGDRAPESPDVVVGFTPGYRASWGTVLGGGAGPVFEDNTRRWSGDHAVAPSFVPGVLASSAPLRSNARLVDVAPTVLSALGVPLPPGLEGASLLP